MKSTSNAVFALPGKIEPLQTLRFLGALSVAIYHFGALTGDCPFDFSHAVYLFYMISGFVVMLSTREPEKRKYFLTRRLIKTLPLYWGLTVLTFIAGQFFPAIVGYKPTAVQLVKSLFFIPFDRATARATTAIRPIVGLGHTLQMEMLFYLLFLAAIRINHKYRGYIAAGLCAAVALTGVFFPTDNPVIHFYTANPYVWTSFVAGMAIYGLFTLIQNKKPPFRAHKAVAVAAVIAAVAAAVPVFIVKTSVWYDIFMLAVVLAAGLTWSACGLKSPQFAVKAGNISYSFYLIHYYIRTLGVRLFDINTPSVRNVLLAAAVCAVAWGVSWVSWYLIENKLSGFLKKRVIRGA
ncbi:MAG: acyltransferase [Clostridia bacterium]|nr:acyltransferase [Clostridia bacterium]